MLALLIEVDDDKSLEHQTRREKNTNLDEETKMHREIRSVYRFRFVPTDISRGMKLQGIGMKETRARRIETNSHY